MTRHGGDSTLANQSITRHSIAPTTTPTMVRVTFETTYWTNWGEHVRVVGASAALGRWDARAAPAMTCAHGTRARELIWTIALDLDDGEDDDEDGIAYRYVVVDARGAVAAFDGEMKMLDLKRGRRGTTRAETRDAWGGRMAWEAVLARVAFANVVGTSVGTMCARDGGVEGDRVVSEGGADGPRVRLEIRAPRERGERRVMVRGTCAALGKGDRSRAKAMSKAAGSDVWWIEFDVDASETPFEYAYFVRDDAGADVEDVRGAFVCSPSASEEEMKSTMVIHRDGALAVGEMWKGAGVALPAFSVRTSKSVGCGDFVDLRRVVDFASETGMSVVQVLPVNDTCVYGTFWDSYPYSSLSVHALHVMYLRAQDLPGVNEELAEDIETARAALDLEEIDYEMTVKEKLSFARRAYYNGGEKVFETDGFKEFYARNEHWLRPYGVFCVLRDLFGTAEHWRWGVFAKYSEDVLDKVDCEGGDLYESTRFWYYLQYNLHEQLLETATYAKSKGIVLKGDLPVGVDKRSVDTWMHPRLFRMDTSTGAPPDAFDPRGQNWGFPTYNWEHMAEDDYAWWRARMQHLEQYFSAIRIDHILGFFRIWELPASATTGCMGRFRPSLPLTRSELASRGLWDVNRLTEPYIQWNELETLFGDHVQDVAYRYMVEKDDQRGLWQFRPDFQTEESIIAATKPHKNTPANLIGDQLAIRDGLMKLFQNRCLLTDKENYDNFYPRFGLEDTSSYQALEGWQRETLRELANDYYFGRQMDTWRNQARMVLPALLRSSDMLVCGEDLGFTPTCVPPVMDELGILGLRIQRMPPVGESAEFGQPHTYSYLTVCSPSCHDTMTTRAWWEQDEARRQRYDAMFHGGTDEKCTPNVMRNILVQHIESPSVLAIFPIQDLLALDAEYAKRPALEETINDPTNPKHYWRYRLHVPCEDMLANGAFVKEIRELLRARAHVNHSLAA